MSRIGMLLVVVSALSFGCAHRPVTRGDRTSRHVDVGKAIDESQRKTDEKPHSETSGDRQEPATSHTP